MWHFRRRPEELTGEQRRELEVLFEALPQLRKLHAIRVRFAETFDTATGRRAALRALVGLFLRMLDEFPELEAFIVTFERWQDEILNYFEAGQTSGVVEGINNKARVIVKRSYGLKSGESLWTRLVLDLNRATDLVKYTLGQIHDLVSGFRDLFAPAYT